LGAFERGISCQSMIVFVSCRRIGLFSARIVISKVSGVYIMTAMDPQLELIKNSIKTIPDYPKPGIFFPGHYQSAGRTRRLCRQYPIAG